MFRVKEKPVHQFLARIPELNHVLLRDTSTNRLELWTESRGVELHAIRLHNQEFEFIREVIVAYRVVDDDYNRIHCPHEIGRIYVDDYPLGASVREL
jgi:hypothetical protein